MAILMDMRVSLPGSFETPTLCTHDNSMYGATVPQNQVFGLTAKEPSPLLAVGQVESFCHIILRRDQSSLKCLSIDSVSSVRHLQKGHVASTK